MGEAKMATDDDDADDDDDVDDDGVGAAVVAAASFLLLRTKHKVKVTGMNITQGSNAQHGRQLKSGPFASQYRNVSFE